ncbi:quinone-dependent dihydroorotate dehydrogenase [Alteromonas ponticola]|uniref:Dihydroorotate dehydrogenase (quinone) n=1 Tax=Alteromonas ponticola TaxID=2720613 RepID=A0ABX1QW02_9ALTE|nr:quinone-dependent dihydroorotate dehydrogenase [Alteromonas ponticola]NMH58424.1 quinone-dependent dihydroorotate dehydrogenase [Alteromonas ponticola]
MQSLIQNLLLKCDPETSHELAIKWLHRTQHTPLNKLYSHQTVSKPTTVAGIKFTNPVGLAAGLDKNGECIDAFAAMGFGFIEVGTVTPRPQSGNPKPRLFRIPEKQAIINRMGFNNKGVDYLVEQVKRTEYDGVIGINIGKNKDTPDEQALSDYQVCLNKVYPYASYITVNISSPNTPGLRNLQHGEALSHLLDGLKQGQEKLCQTHSKYVPIFVKIAPDLSQSEVSDFARALIKSKMDGVIATNTTLDRKPVEGLKNAEEAGGLSGEVLDDKSYQVTKQLAAELDRALPIISVGGIHSENTARQRLDAGASLIQVYSAFIYQGPDLIKRIAKSL